MNELARTIERVRRDYNLIRMYEAFAVLLIISGCGAITYYYTMEVNNWNSEDGSIALTATLLGGLALWLIARKVFGFRPMHADETHFEEWAREELAQKSANSNN